MVWGGQGSPEQEEKAEKALPSLQACCRVCFWLNKAASAKCRKWGATCPMKAHEGAWKVEFAFRYQIREMLAVKKTAIYDIHWSVSSFKSRVS